MIITPTAIPDVLIIEPKVFQDQRGFFWESFNQKNFEQATGVYPQFVQDNHSGSKHNVMRGLHYQIPGAQGKLIRVVRGAVFDVAVDLRQSSPHCGQWVGCTLTADNHKQFWIPPGFAHGFLVTSDFAEVLYKTTDYYHPDQEYTIRWDDPDLKIDWPLTSTPILSPKDSKAQSFKEAKLFP